MGVFIIVSRAFNPRFYSTTTSAETLSLDDEIASAESHFISLIHYFADHHIAVLDGVMIDCWYIVKRMLAEFAAAAVVFSLEIQDGQEESMDMEVDGQEGEEEGDMIPLSKVKAKIDDIIARSYPEAMGYYLNCVAAEHQHFTWTGPALTILPRSEGCDFIVGLLTSEGEKLDHPTHPIFAADMALLPPPPASYSTSLSATRTKRRGSTHDADMQAKKQRQ